MENTIFIKDRRVYAKPLHRRLEFIYKLNPQQQLNLVEAL